MRRVFSIPRQSKAASLFVIGTLTAFVALLVEDFAWPILDPLVPAQHASAIHAFLMIALIEEMAKLGLIYGQAMKINVTNYRVFAILAAFVAAGFAGAENLLFIAKYGTTVIFDRVITATPFHICNAIVASRMIWLAVHEGKYWYAPLALITAVFLHGFYDYSIMTDSAGDGKFWFALGMTAALALGLMRRQEA